MFNGLIAVGAVDTVCFILAAMYMGVTRCMVYSGATCSNMEFWSALHSWLIYSVCSVWSLLVLVVSPPSFATSAPVMPILPRLRVLLCMICLDVQEETGQLRCVSVVPCFTGQFLEYRNVQESVSMSFSLCSLLAVVGMSVTIGCLSW